MRKIVFILLFLLWVDICMAAVPSRTITYVSGETINPSDVTTNEDNIYSYLAAGVEAIAANTVVTSDIVDGTIIAGDIATGGVATGNILDGTIATADMADEAVTTEKIASGTIVNLDISGSAAIHGSKLNLSAPGAIGGTTAAAGSFTTLSATELFTLTSGQIAFPASASASAGVNTLDDYEEGTYTVTLTCGTSGTITVNAANNTFAYTKIGRMVYIGGAITSSAISSPVGLIDVNLPFVPTNLTESSDQWQGVIEITGGTGSLTGIPIIVVTSGATTATIYDYAAMVAQTDIAAHDDGSTDYTFTFSYISE